MRLNEITYPDLPPIDSYGPGFFRIGGEIHQGPLLLLPQGHRDWAGWTETAPLLSAQVDVLFLGTGAETGFAPAELRAALEAADVAYECMATGPACRTYNVLLSEGRRIGAALLPV